MIMAGSYITLFCQLSKLSVRYRYTTLLSLLVDQGPTARILALFTCRPDFSPPWTGRAHLTQVTLNRLPRRQAAELTGRVAPRQGAAR